MQYVATFFTHYDAIVFHRLLLRQKVENTLGPVPRALSSSCGTCVRFVYSTDIHTLEHAEFEQLARDENGGYTIVFDRRG
ncbi:MAG: DUF3343 domain-containing protein [Ruthenibacterium sp.]